MFGYVRARREDLKVRDDALYRGVYCGLCRAMGKCTGTCSRLSLSYDIVFLYLIRASLTGTKPELRKGRCLLHPFFRRPFLKRDKELDYAARASALLTCGKIRDDLADERGWKRFVKRLCLPFAVRAEKRADLTELAEAIRGHLRALSEIEQSELSGVDAPADVFGHLLADVFAYGLSGDERTLASGIGFRTGRWIYAADAADDMENDAKSGAYNPFLRLYGGLPDEKQRQAIGYALSCDLQALSAALDLLPDGELRRIAQNIVYLGMPDAAARALRKKGGSLDQESV